MHGILLLVQFFMLFGGFFNNLEFSPAWLDWIKHISWYKYSTEIFLADQWEGYLIYCPIRKFLIFIIII